MKKLLTLTAFLVIGCHIAAGNDAGAGRRCTTPSGKLLYVVKGDKVHTPNGQLLGTLKNGEVRDPSGKLIAHQGNSGCYFYHQ